MPLKTFYKCSKQPHFPELTQGSFEFLEHTADIRLKVQALTLPELFAAAARGMTSYIFGDHILRSSTDKQEGLEVEAEDLDSLLIEWLSKLLFLSSTAYRAYLEFGFFELDPRRARTVIKSCPAEALQEIKAVTYHGLKVTEVAQRWEAIVTFDI